MSGPTNTARMTVPSYFKCMKNPTTSTNFTIDITKRLITRIPFGMPGTYSVATSIAVMSASTIATLMYVLSVA